MVVASIATIPTRVNNGDLRACIDGLLGQSHRIDTVFVSIPKVYARFKETVDELPSWLHKEPYASRVIVLRPEKDAGPITKYVEVGAFLQKHADKYGDPFVFVGDDDQVYHPHLVQRMMASLPTPDFKGVIQNRYEIVRYGSGGIIHGFVGLCVSASCLRALPLFPRNKAGFFVDDQVMSIYFATYNIPMIPSRVIDYADIYKVFQDGHERGVHAPEALHMLGNRNTCITEICDMYSVRFGYGGVIDIDWHSLYMREAIRNCQCVRLVGPPFMVKELRKSVTDVRFSDSDFEEADALLYLVVDSEGYGIRELEKHLAGVKNGASIYVKFFKCSLREYDVIVNRFGVNNVSHLLPSTFEVKNVL